MKGEISVLLTMGEKIVMQESVIIIDHAKTIMPCMCGHAKALKLN